MMCQVCLHGKLTIMGPLAVCAYCEKAWLYHEYVAAVRAADEQAEQIENTEAT